MHSSKKFIRDSKRVIANLRELDDGSLATVKGCTIYIPSQFLEKNLAQLSPEKYICGLCAVVVEDLYYGVLSVNAMIGISPDSTSRVEFDGEEYVEFKFGPGSILMPNLNLVQIDTLVYRIYDQFMSNGRVPWYMDNEDMARVFDTARKHAGAHVGTEHEITEMIVSLISRDPKDRTKYYRQTIDSKDELKTRPPVFVPLKSVHYSATNTVNKLAGNYFDEGVRSAIISPATRVEAIESLLTR